MKPTPIPVALRAYAVRRGTAPAETDAGSPPPTAPQRRARRADPRWPKHVLVFDTETTADEAQRLLFGGYRVLRWTPTGHALELIAEGLFHENDLAAWNPSAMTELQQYATTKDLTLFARRKFMDTVFRHVALDMRGLVVGFNLPFDLSRIAIGAGEARGDKFRGGFSFALWDYFDKKRGRWVEHPYRPRVCVKSLDSKRAFIGFARPMRADRSPVSAFRGNFLDVRTLAFALSARSHSLDSACKAFGVKHGKTAVEEHGKLTAEYIAYNRRDVQATHKLLERLRIEFDQLGLSLPPTRAYSPASIAKASLRDMGVRPLLGKSAVSSVELGRAMTAFYGGRADGRIRRVPVPVVPTDYRSMYPTVTCNLGLWPILTAETVRFVDYTEELRALLKDATPTAALNRALWPQLCGFAEVEPDEDILPVRGKYSEVHDGLNIGSNYFSSPVPIIYAAPDVYASALLTGKAPKIRRAWKLVGEGAQPGLKPLLLGGRIPIDPRKDDFFRMLIEERVRVKNSADLPPEERERVAQLLKITANSGYGIFAEMNREELPSDTTAEISVFGRGEPFEQTTSAPEDLGEFCFPPIAALISAGARLMLALLERCVTDRGGHYAFCDTDSMAIVATQFGGLVPCEGGTDDHSDRIEAIRALTWKSVEDIRAQLNALNPYDRSVIPDILNIEDVNFRNGIQRELSAYVISAKRYVLIVVGVGGRDSD